MPLAPAITDLEQLKDRPVLADLLSWRADAVQRARLDRDELTIFVAREPIREAHGPLKAQKLTNFFFAPTCAAFYPPDSPFYSASHHLSVPPHTRARLQLRS